MQTITAIHTSGIKLFRNFKKLNPNVIFISIKYEIIKLILYEIIAFLATVPISPKTIPSTIPIRVVDDDKTPVIKRFFVLPRLWNIAPGATWDMTKTEEKERVELAEKYAANPIFAAKYPELATFKDEYYKSVATNIFDENLVVNIKFKLSQANGTVNPQGTRGAPELIKGTNNYLTTSDPGFVDYANGNYELKPDSEVFKKIPEFQNIDMSKMGNNEPVGPSN